MDAQDPVRAIDDGRSCASVSIRLQLKAAGRMGSAPADAGAAIFWGGAAAAVAARDPLRQDALIEHGAEQLCDADGSRVARGARAPRRRPSRSGSMRRRARRLRCWVMLASLSLLMVVAFISPAVPQLAPVFGGLTDLIGLTRSVSLTVNGLSQPPELPSGCEITSLAICLRHAGFTADACSLSDRYLPRQLFSEVDGVRYGGDPEQVFVGDPRSVADAYRCFAKPIVAAADAFLLDRNSKLRAHDLTGSPFDELERIIDTGVPVMAWTTLDGQSLPALSKVSWTIRQSGAAYRPFVNLHCVVLCGYDSGRRTVTACDPLAKGRAITYGLDGFVEAYHALGDRAVAIY